MFTVILAIVMLVSMSTSVLAAGNNGKDNKKTWEVQTDSNGKVYLKNVQTGEKLVEVFKDDESGNTIKIDLIEYAQTLNQLITNQNQEDFTVKDDSLTVTPYSTSVVGYTLTGVTTYISYGNHGPLKATPTMYGPTSFKFGQSVTVSETFSANVSGNVEATKTVKLSASFAWNKTLTTNTTLDQTYTIPAGMAGYLQFRPLYNTVWGELHENLYVNGQLVLTKDLGPAIGYSPKKLASGFADGYYELILY